VNATILPCRLYGCLGFVALLSTCAFGQAGPPFKTDDPETPGNGRWEVNVGFLGSRNPQGGSYQSPVLDTNYGVGKRIQLKYELPLAVAESRPQPGLGNSMAGVKVRFYERHAGQSWGGSKRGTSPDPTITFSVSTYPQFTFENPTRSVARGVVSNGPDLLLPLEMNARMGPVRIDAEVGYHFGNRALAQSWIRGLLVGHEFTERLEAYVEIYDHQDANRKSIQSLTAEACRNERRSSGRRLSISADGMGSIGRSQ